MKTCKLLFLILLFSYCLEAKENKNIPTKDKKYKVVINNPDGNLYADSLVIDGKSKKLKSLGEVKYEGNDFVIIGNNMLYSKVSNELSLSNVRYKYVQDVKGKAKYITKVKENFFLNKATYTTCNRIAKTNYDWEISVDNLEIFSKDKLVIGKKAIFKVKDKPILYLPYFMFPFSDESRSGFLYPYGSYSSTYGFSFILPYYLKLAPNYDLTLYPVLFVDKKINLQSEFRYLFNKHNGISSFAYMPRDDYNNKKQDRWLLNIKHYSKFNNKLSAYINISDVSDNNYFDDLDTSFRELSSSLLKKEFALTYLTNLFDIKFYIDDYKYLIDIDSTEEPYKLLPKISLLTTDFIYKKLQHNYKLEFSNFSHKNARNARRFAAESFVKADLWRENYGFITPSVKLYYNYYDLYKKNQIEEQTGSMLTYWLNDNANNIANDLNPSNSVFSTKIDTGLIFEKMYNAKYKQSLEPKLTYLYTPRRDYSDIPLFDTLEYVNGVDKLFRYNRFSGTDRIGDANQIVSGVNSHIYNEGKEMMSFRVAQAFSFTDKKVLLNNEFFQNTEDLSLLVMDSSYNIRQDSNIRLLSHWSHIQDNIELIMLSWHKKWLEKLLININYQYHNNAYKKLKNEEVNFSTVYKANNKWQFTANIYQDINNNSLLEYIYGIEYKKCCWGVRLVTRKRIKQLSDVNSVDGRYNKDFFLEFRLKGLGGVGNKTASLLKNKIKGYTSLLSW